MTDSNPEAEKLAAFQGLVARHYVPAFVTKLAEHGFNIEDETELAHVLQLNGKFAAVLGDGASLDTLVDAITAQLNVKAAAEGSTNISVGSINHAMDSAIKSAGVEVNDNLSAATADGVYTPATEDIEALKTISG
jgi:hypothetical protein